MSEEHSEENNEEFIESEYDGELYNADPDCVHVVIALWSGVKCNGWFCF